MGPDIVWPPEGVGGQRKAKSSWSASHRNIRYTPPADLRETHNTNMHHVMQFLHRTDFVHLSFLILIELRAQLKKV